MSQQSSITQIPTSINLALTSQMQKHILEQLLAKESLNTQTMHLVFSAIMHGQCSPEWTASFISLLRAKGETSEELNACLSVMRQLMVVVTHNLQQPVLDIVGTGGDGLSTFNISTAAMFLAASCGVAVAKHGGRSASSNSGSADCLEALGANIYLTPEQISQTLTKFNIGFMFAPNHHPAMRHVAPIRKLLGIRTLFNLLGPLSNPAQVKRLILGVSDRHLQKTLAQVLQLQGVKNIEKAWVITSENGMDEISATHATSILEVDSVIGPLKIEPLAIHPQTYFADTNHTVEDLYAGNAQESAHIIQTLLNPSAYQTALNGIDKQSWLAKAQALIMNAASVIYMADRSASYERSIEVASKAMASGDAYTHMLAYCQETQILANKTNDKT